jgi:tetrathionate reductase subunit B
MIKRRTFIKGLAALSSAIFFLKSTVVWASSLADDLFRIKKPKTDPDPGYHLYHEDLYPETSDKRYGMVIDLRKCIGCHSCATACRDEYSVPAGYWRSWVKVIEKGVPPKRYFLPRLCNHCDDAPCVAACPPGASFRRADGVILIDYDKCIGCRYCMAACPYDARFINPIRKTAEKCTFCIHRVDKGIPPACVEICPVNARIFGDIEDPNSELSKLIATGLVQVLKPEMGTIPKVYYIRVEKDIIGRIPKESE